MNKNPENVRTETESNGYLGVEIEELERIEAPGTNLNHNETFVRDSVK